MTFQLILFICLLSQHSCNGVVMPKVYSTEAECQTVAHKNEAENPKAVDHFCAQI